MLLEEVGIERNARRRGESGGGSETEDGELYSDVRNAPASVVLAMSGLVPYSYLSAR